MKVRKLERVIDVLNKESLFIDAVIDVDGINRVSQYEYLTKDITEEVRANLFSQYFWMQQMRQSMMS